MNLLQLLWFRGSRKVGFGLWLFLVGNIYLVMKLINSEQWFTVVCLSSALVGGGTAFDRWLENKKGNGEGTK
jgi:hypothetical protein